MSEKEIEGTATEITEAGPEEAKPAKKLNGANPLGAAAAPAPDPDAIPAPPAPTPQLRKFEIKGLFKSADNEKITAFVEYTKTIAKDLKAIDPNSLIVLTDSNGLKYSIDTDGNFDQV